jgi:hypothetical protein
MGRSAKSLIAIATAIAVSGAIVACGGDDTTGNNPGADGGTIDGSHVDGSSDGAPDTAPADSGADTARTDGGDGGCDFNAFVIGLIQNHTSSTEQPSTDLGQNCVDTQTPFPSTLFQ